MSKSSLHNDLQSLAQNYLRNRQYWICGQEVRMPLGICDAWGMKRGWNQFGNETMAIEVKVSRSDFKSKSQQYKEIMPRPLGNYQYILCPKKLIQPEEIHKEWGLLWWDEKTNRIYNKKKAPLLEMTDTQKLDVLIYFLDNGVNYMRPKLMTKNTTDDCYLQYDEGGYLTCSYNHKLGEECLMNRESKIIEAEYKKHNQL